MAERNGITPLERNAGLEMFLNRLQYTDNRPELQDLTEYTGINFGVRLPKKVDVKGGNWWLFLRHSVLREAFGIPLGVFLDPRRENKFAGIYSPQLDTYLDFLIWGNNEFRRSKTCYHEAAHAYIHRKNPQLEEFIEEMNKKMIGKSGTKRKLTEIDFARLTPEEASRYIAYNQVAEGVAEYLAIETIGHKKPYSLTSPEQLYNFHQSQRGTVIILDTSSRITAHQRGYRNVMYAVEGLGRLGVGMLEAINLIITNPPEDPEYFFWQNNEYIEDLFLKYETAAG